jgi:XRE family aerobic/anaerobic benzoate catabolism transcriptional regulator
VPKDDVTAFMSAAGDALRLGGAGADLSDDAYLRAIGERLRAARAERGFSRRLLAERSGISERYIAMMEAGTGNVSVLLLRALASSLGIAPAALLDGRVESPASSLLARLDPEQLATAHALLSRHFATRPASGRDGRVALIGLPGAGKSTLGRMLANRHGGIFVELDDELSGRGLAAAATQAGGGLSPRVRTRLDRLLAGDRIVLASRAEGGDGLVSRLLGACRTVWLRATPEEHLRRLNGDGVARRARRDRRALDELRVLLATREPLYARADHVLDTSGQSPEDSFRELQRLLG